MHHLYNKEKICILKPKEHGDWCGMQAAEVCVGG